MGCDDFSDALCIASFGTRLINCVSDRRYFYNPRLLLLSNLHQLYDFESLGDDKRRFAELAKSVDLPGFEKVVATLESNFSGLSVSVDEQYVSALMDEHFDANFLSFKNIEGRLFRTWQEALLCDSLSLSFSNGSIEPKARFRSGEEYPDTSTWSHNVLSLAKEAMRDDRAICVIEVLEYCKCGKTPAMKSQDLLVDLLLGHVEKCCNANDPIWKLSCTALKVVRSLLDSKKLEEKAKEKYFKSLLGLLSSVSGYDEIRFMKENGLPCTKKQKELFLAKTKRWAKDSLASTACAQDLIAILKDPRSSKYCDFDDAKLSFELFLEYAREVDVATAELFYCAMMFYIDIQDNPQVDNMWTRGTLITLRHLWQEYYYEAVVANMQVISHEGTVSGEVVKQFNKDFLERPHAVARSLFLQSDDDIVKNLESMAEHVLVFHVNKTTISEYYPEHIHVSYERDARPIDNMIASEIMRVYRENSYRFLNAMSEREVINGYYDHLSSTIEIGASFIDAKPVYEWIVENAPSHYELLSFPEVQPTLAHLTQLFPVLENIIREIGEWFAIVPFQADRDSYTRLKDVVSVLSGLIGEVQEITGTIQGCNEFLFVYHVMYSPNGFNVRNDCIHGRQYQGPTDVARAFRLTVICVYMMLKRLRDLEAMNSES